MLSAESIRQFRRPVEIVPLRLEFSSPHENIFELYLSLDTVTGHSEKKMMALPPLAFVQFEGLVSV